MVEHRLSKSKFLSGLQCHKRLYLELHQPELADEPDAQTEAAFELGQEIGQLARRRFPGGVLVSQDHAHLAEAVKETASLVKNPAVPAIFEATFVHDGVLVRVDILKRAGQDQWRLIEVKAAMEVKAHYHDDVALQAHVLTGAGVRLAGSSVLHVNREYVYLGGDLDLQGLFAETSVTREVSERLPAVPDHLAEMQAMLSAGAAPTVEPDGHCRTPYTCPFWTHCIKAKPERWIFSLPRIGTTFEVLRQRGIESIDDIPDDVPLSALQQRVKNNVEWVHQDLKQALATIRYPVHHLDFETFTPAIPRYPGTRPYQRLPIQWSVHREEATGVVRHHAYLCVDPKDPREDFAISLLEALGQEGSLCVYSSFEKTVLTDLAAAYPALRRDLERLIARLWDLLPLLQAHYYHPACLGSYSLKNVLPAVVPSLAYDDLEIQNGGQAEQAYAHMLFVAADPQEKARIRQALLRYCERDTLALVELRQALWRKASAP